MKEQSKKNFTEMTRKDGVRSRMKFAATAEIEELFRELGTRQEGLNETLVEKSRDNFGNNKVSRGKKPEARKFRLKMWLWVILCIYRQVIWCPPICG